MSKVPASKDVVSAAAALEEAITKLKKAESDYDTVKGLGGQVGYNVSVNGVSIAVATMHPHTCQGTLVRGREMIHLGALKAMQGMIDAWKVEVVRRRAVLRQLAADLAEAV